ncbi:hypothetical protein KW791_01045, partial [Candidatus Parcubacteria bacterium]|nr:hypothetical protein [Candidatus Parcubacteria bacterium]
FMHKKELIEKLRALGVVKKGEVQLKFGGASSVYIDIKKAYGHPEALRLIGKYMQQNIPKKTTCIAASGYGGLPLATYLSSKNNLKLTLVREKPKNHGTSAWIDGYIPNTQDDVLIVDDVITTGKGVKQTMKVLKSAKAKVIGCSVLVKRTDVSLKIPLKHILTLKDLQNG